MADSTCIYLLNTADSRYIYLSKMADSTCIYLLNTADSRYIYLSKMADSTCIYLLNTADSRLTYSQSYNMRNQLPYSNTQKQKFIPVDLVSTSDGEAENIKRHIDGILAGRVSIELAETAKESWRRRDITNFEYLMVLNTLAGRSYNDLTQYPVFPWVLADYTSDVLDFNKSSTFRDLSKPVGALDQKQFEVFEVRAIYLHHTLQGGKFYHSDRLFQSMESTYRTAFQIKELVPQFFYMPAYHLGVKQDGEPLNDVGFPPWAKTRDSIESQISSHQVSQVWFQVISQVATFQPKELSDLTRDAYVSNSREAAQLSHLGLRIRPAPIPCRMMKTPLTYSQSYNMRNQLPYSNTQKQKFIPVDLVSTSDGEAENIKRHIDGILAGYTAIELAETAKESWRRRDITNFEYLMVLNTLAGRSYNDLTQYPVFPWGGKFYHSDRLFQSMESTYRTAFQIKELVPQFFYMPAYHLGVKQDGEPLNDVGFPPWAKAANIFYYVTYEGDVDLETMEDELQRIGSPLAENIELEAQCFTKMQTPFGKYGRLNCFKLSSCGEFLVCAGDQGQIVVRSMKSLEIIGRYSGAGKIITLLTVTQEECVLAETNPKHEIIKSDWDVMIYACWLIVIDSFIQWHCADIMPEVHRTYQTCSTNTRLLYSALYLSPLILGRTVKCGLTMIEIDTF
ncbi:BEACH domain-containing protein B isoform X1 [Tanacetum coccineum]